MGLLDNFEQRLERAVNGAFSKTFRSGVQPLEITSALRHELDVKAAVVSRERILVDAQRHAAQRLRRELAEDPIWPIAADDRHDLAAPEPQAAQAQGD